MRRLRCDAGTSRPSRALFQVTTPAPRRTRHAAGQVDHRRVGEPAPARRRSGRRTRGGSARRPGSAIRGTGTMPRSQAIGSARLPRPSRTARRSGHRRARWASLAMTRVAVRAAPSQTVGLGDPVARPGRVDRGKLGPQGDDEIALRPCDGSRPWQRVRGRRGRRGPRADQALLAARGRFRAPASRSMSRTMAAASRAGSWWWAFVGVDEIVEDEARGGSSIAGGQRSRTDSLSPVRRGPRARSRLLARTTSTMPGRPWREQRLDVIGQVEAGRSRRPGWRRCRRRCGGRARQPPRRRSPARGAPAGGS